MRYPATEKLEIIDPEHECRTAGSSPSPAGGHFGKGRIWDVRNGGRVPTIRWAAGEDL